MRNFVTLAWLLAATTVAVASPPFKSIPEQLESSLVSRTSDSETLSQCQESHKNDDFWMETIDHTGTYPFLNDSSYVVYRNVKDFGAKGDGAADDTAAIQRAIDDGGRCFTGCGPDTVAPAKTLKPALIYFPAGEYRITSTINMYLFTQLVGNPRNGTTIKADANFVGLYLLNAFPSLPVSPFPTTTNLYLQVRNFQFDTTAVDIKSAVACINWPSAQAVTLSYSSLVMAERSMHQGVVFNGTTGGGGGSATFMGDLTFTGGNIGCAQ